MTTTDTSALRGELAERAASVPATTGEAKPKTIEDLIRAQGPEIARALPKHMDAERLARIALTTMRTTPKLLECTQASLMGALMLSAQVGLEPGPLGHCYLAPRKNKERGGVLECTWILGYKGIIELARRSGKIDRIEAREVCEADHFEFEYGLNERLEHRPRMDGERGEITAFWGLATFSDGGHYFLVMSKSEVDAAKMRSDLGKYNKGPWRDDYAAMGRKTLVRRMAPWLPLSSEHLAMIEQDETVHTELRPEMFTPPPTWSTPAIEPPPADADGVPTSPSSPPEPPPASSSSAPAAQGPPPPIAPNRPEPVVEAEGPAAGPPPSSAPVPRHPFDPDPEVDPGAPMTDDQNNALHKLLRAKRGAVGPARFVELTKILERPIAAMSELTTDDAANAIDILNAEPG